jgi:hypothetical protein
MACAGRHRIRTGPVWHAEQDIRSPTWPAPERTAAPARSRRAPSRRSQPPTAQRPTTAPPGCRSRARAPSRRGSLGRPRQRRPAPPPATPPPRAARSASATARASAARHVACCARPLTGARTWLSTRVGHDTCCGQTRMAGGGRVQKARRRTYRHLTGQRVTPHTGVTTCGASGLT